MMKQKTFVVNGGKIVNFVKSDDYDDDDVLANSVDSDQTAPYGAV